MTEAGSDTPTVADVDVAFVRGYLRGTANSVDDTTLGVALAAERVAQWRVCVADPLGGPLVSDLAEALCRRVARNLAMRGVPLAVQTGELGPVRLGAGDPEIGRLEKPHLRLDGPGVG